MSSPGASPPAGSPPANNNTTPPPVAAPPPTAPVVPPPAQVVPPPPVSAQPPSPPVTPAAPPPANPTPNPTPPSNPVPNPTPPTPSNPTPNPTPPSPPSTNPTPVNPTTPGTPVPPSRNNPSPPQSSGGGGGASPNSNSGSPSLSSGAIIGIAAAGALILLTLVLVVCCLRRKPKRKYRRDEEYESGQYKAEMYESGRRPRPPPPPPPPHHKHYAYGSPVPPPPPPPPPPHHFSSGGSQDSWRPVPPPPPPPPPAHHHAMSSSIGNSRSWFTYEELEAATGGFSRSNLLGEGGFGCVYKGYLPGGQVVAVKQLKVGSGQGEREFRAEVEIISRVHHRHLVSLVGYCIADSQRLLVYDYVPNGTLEHHLHGKGRPVMNWPTRLRIAAGAARGLAYLHEDCHPRIIHRDIKSSNILLDNNFEAQVSDFGLAKLASDTYTHVTTRVMGTFGYLAPEYASTGKLTEKSDVYSFGVVLLELITGRRPVDTTQPVGDESLVEWARPYLSEAVEDGNIHQALVDKRLIDYNENEMLRMVEAAAACVRHSASKRPRMAQVVRALESDSAISDLNQGIKPGHSSNYGSADYDTNQYISDMRKFKKMAFGSQEHGSEYSGPTSEYGINPSASSSEALSSVEMDSKRRAGLRSTDTSSSEINVNNSDALNGR